MFRGHQKLLTVIGLAMLVTALPSLLGARPGPPRHWAKRAEKTGYVGNEACASCHSKIYESYERTAMARASGPATENFISGDFKHKKSSVHYRVAEENGRVWLTFERTDDPSVHGKRELLYYIGSGKRGRSYLFAVDGFLFESPVNWYSDGRTWDMAPAYQEATEIPLNLPAYPSCLQCHVSGMQPPIEGTENRYPTPPFAFDGVACERCHGPGGAHIHGGPIVNPAKLAPERRDSICRQCHLEAKVAIERAGRHAYEFRPGDLLTDYVRYYVASGQPNGLGAVSQVEALEQSQCKRKSGAAMSCTSCHDPHSSPAPAERVAYFRAKCLACHGERFGKKHHSEQPDCVRCHMPSVASADIAHTQVTDHRIPRIPILQTKGASAEVAPTSTSLLPFPDTEEARHDVRDMALAWSSIANSGASEAAPEAERLLRAAVAQTPDDPVLLSALGYMEQRHGATDRARELYEKALAADSNLIDAAVNLGVIEANAGRIREALRLWNGVFARAPGRSAIGMNMAKLLCEDEQYEGARSALRHVLEFNPDLASAKAMLRQLNQTPPECR